VRKLTARLLFGGSLLAALGAGLSLGFLMDYFLGWQFGASELVLELTDTQSYSVLAFMAIVAPVSAISFFRKKKPADIPDVALSLLHHCITLAAVLVMGVSSYCLLPSSVRNTAFGWGVTDFLFAFPGEAGLLRKTLTEKRPDPAEGRIDFYTPAPLIGSSWETRPGIRGVDYDRRSNALVLTSFLHGHNRHIVAVFLTGLDEAATEKVLAEDLWGFHARPLFSTRTQGLTLEWQDITFR
jgi:hypothetical protein